MCVFFVLVCVCVCSPSFVCVFKMKSVYDATFISTLANFFMIAIIIKCRHVHGEGKFILRETQIRKPVINWTNIRMQISRN